MTHACCVSRCMLQADSISNVEERLQAAGIQHKKTVFIEDGYRVSQVGCSLPFHSRPARMCVHVAPCCVGERVRMVRRHPGGPM
jgi:hypothetical protein